MKKTEFLPTEFIRFNKMLAGELPGGIPTGKIIEIFGFEGCGKTTVALELSRIFKSVYYIDFENELDMEYVAMLDAHLSKVIQPVTFEEGIDLFFRDLKKKKYDCLIVDTIGSAITEGEIEKELKDCTVGIRAQKVTIFCKKAEKILKPLGVTVILLNHKKDRIGSGFGERFYTPGGRQIKYSASIRLSITEKKCKIFDDAIITNIWTKKNKVAKKLDVPNIEYIIRRGKGISRGEEAMCLGLETGVVKKTGQTFKIGSKTFRGKVEVIEFLDAEVKVRKAIYDKWSDKQD